MAETAALIALAQSQFLLNPPLFVGYLNTQQLITNTTWTAFGLDTSVVDTYSGHSTVTNNSRYTAQVAGWYTVSGIGTFVNNSTGARGVRMHVNGTLLKGSASFEPPSSGSDTAVPSTTRDVFLNIGDYVEIAIWQNSGGSLNTTNDPDLACAMWVRYSHQ